MKTYPLGGTGVEVSAMCLGAMYFGTRNDRESSFALLDQYVEAGGSFIDTANIYAHWVEGFQGGESEMLLGEWMRERGNRSDLFLASKVGFALPGVEQGLRAWQIEAECDKSLRKLGVDIIDLYYAHVDDRSTPQEESLEAFARLHQAGKVRFIGASNFRAWRLEQAHAISAANGWPDYCCLQQRYTYLRPKHDSKFGGQVAVNEDLLDYLRTRRDDFTLLAYSPLLSGAYTRDDRPLPEQYVGADSEARLAALREVAAAHDATLNQVVLAWMLHSDPVVLPVMAASTSEQMAENLAALDLALSPDEMARLNTAKA
ncbi:MAG TPA: aldo/keto reductase [Aggregatilinea sp.]|uniref:aldo/keto reductase n=1 Tax=Aggregatilinea sp. TaxID=2806333 RepID=UPI002BB0FAE6|nr:aldo/keto reductase [Aggregatilinea sp.]HML24324.1 aldo/keto reductase [Aggregatilinea sp.]